MKTELYLMMVFLWKYKETLEDEDLTLDDSIYISQEVVKNYMSSDDYSPDSPAEVEDFFDYVEDHLTDYLN